MKAARTAISPDVLGNIWRPLNPALAEHRPFRRIDLLPPTDTATTWGSPQSYSPEESLPADFRYPDWMIRSRPVYRAGGDHERSLAPGHILTDERMQASRSFSSNGLVR